MIQALRVLFALAALAWLMAPAQAQGYDQAQTPDVALDRLLADAREKLPEACDDPESDRLIRVLCAQSIRVGVRAHYPLFATQNADQTDRMGYDIDVARAIASRLGVTPEWVQVSPAMRISALAEDSVDLVIATMGHNTQRDGQTQFIRPHYYRSETIIVGPHAAPITDWRSVAGRRVCTTIGNYANAQLVSRGAQLMLFENAARLPEALDEEICRLVAQDDSFLASFLVDPAFGDRFERKFGFDPVPWGMAVAQTGSDDLGQALRLISQILHRDGHFLNLARQNGIFTQFLEEQQSLWQSPACATVAALDDSACVMPALKTTRTPTAFADEVEELQDWMRARFGFAPDLPMLTSQPALELFTAGVINSFVLVVGALVATLVFALFFGLLAALPSRATRFLAWSVVSLIQSSPVILTLVVLAAVTNAVFAYSPATALGSAIVALGLMNGCNAGQAIGEAAESLRKEGHHGPGFSLPLFRDAVTRSLTQLFSFLVNAAKGTPIASFTGAPELLSALTDITSFAAGRVTTYSLVLVFYIAVVFCVIWLCNTLRARLERSQGEAGA